MHCKSKFGGYGLYLGGNVPILARAFFLFSLHITWIKLTTSASQDEDRVALGAI